MSATRLAALVALFCLHAIAVYAIVQQPTEENELEDPWDLDLTDLLDAKAKSQNYRDDPKAPRYMTRLFRALTNESRPLEREVERKLPHICYLGLGPTTVPGRRGAAKFFFNTSIEEGRGLHASTVLKARLLLKFVQAEKGRSGGSGNRVIVTVSKIKKIRSGGRIRVTKIGERRVSTRKVSSYVEFGLTGVVRDWFDQPEKNYGLLVSVSRSQGSTLQFPVVNDPNEQPLLIVTIGVGSASTQRRTKRSRRQTPDELESEGTRRRDAAKRAKALKLRSDACQLEEFWVDLKWPEWRFIIAPEKYDASICTGECTAPLLGHDNPSTHSIVLSNLPKERQKTTPCCVPIAYAPLSLLFSERNDLIIYRPFPDMKATACGCR